MRGAAESPRANTAARAAVISEYLKALKLPAFAGEYEGLVRQAGVAHPVEPEAAVRLETAAGTTKTSSGSFWR